MFPHKNTLSQSPAHFYKRFGCGRVDVEGCSADASGGFGVERRGCSCAERTADTVCLFSPQFSQLNLTFTALHLPTAIVS